MKYNFNLLILIFVILVSCEKENEQNQIQSNAQSASLPSTQVEQKNVTPVSACEALTLEDLKLIYPDKKFSVETNRNDAPNIYEALSACRYKEEEKELIDLYYVDLEIRARASSEDAIKIIQDRKETDYDKKGKSVAGYGQDAYYTGVSMAYGGPRLEFAKDNIYYKVSIQTIKSGAAASLENDILNIAKKILE